MTDPLKNFDDLNEYEQSILEYELLSKAFNNSFRVLTKRKTMIDIVKENGGWKVKSGNYTPLHSGSGIPD